MVHVPVLWRNYDKGDKLQEHMDSQCCGSEIVIISYGNYI